MQNLCPRFPEHAEFTVVPPNRPTSTRAPSMMELTDAIMNPVLEAILRGLEASLGPPGVRGRKRVLTSLPWLRSVLYFWLYRCIVPPKKGDTMESRLRGRTHLMLYMEDGKVQMVGPSAYGTFVGQVGLHLPIQEVCDMFCKASLDLLRLGVTGHLPLAVDERQSSRVRHSTTRSVT